MKCVVLLAGVGLLAVACGSPIQASSGQNSGAFPISQAGTYSYTLDPSGCAGSPDFELLSDSGKSDIINIAGTTVSGQLYLSVGNWTGSCGTVLPNGTFSAVPADNPGWSITLTPS
jgi:hypothetical protein